MLKDDVQKDGKTYNMDWSLGSYNKEEFTVGQHGKQIIGFRVVSGWNNSTNGWFKMHKGKNLDGEVKVEFCSEKTRGCSWYIDVWMVDKLFYEQQEIS